MGALEDLVQSAEEERVVECSGYMPTNFPQKRQIPINQIHTPNHTRKIKQISLLKQYLDHLIEQPLISQQPRTGIHQTIRILLHLPPLHLTQKHPNDLIIRG